MYNKKKSKNKIIIFFSIIIVFVIIFFSLRINRNYLVAENYLKDTAMIINKVFMYPFTTLTKEKNIDQSESYVIQKNVNTALEDEIKELKEALELNESLTEYSAINATVLSRNKSYWFNTITIDKGKSSGLKKGMAVITKNGLVGLLYKVSDNSSEIKLITADDVNYKVSVSITVADSDTYGILNGYDRKTGLMTITGVDKLSNVEIGNEVLTSGLGGKFPRGIYIGKVHSISTDKYNLSKTLKIKTNQDFNKLHYVTVLKEKKND